MGDDRPVIMVSNDDGVYSRGLKILYESVSRLGDTVVVAPETPKSSSGLGLTLHKPLRLEELHMWDTVVYAINGTPSDVVHLALNVLTNRIDLVVSGVNIGDNTSIQVILSSGTVGAAAQAGLLGIPAIAFSAAVSSQEDLEDDIYVSFIRKVIRELAWQVIKNGMPEGVDVINVNFPGRIDSNTRIKIARPARLRYLEHMVERRDPLGRRYFWLYGKPVEPEKDTDVYVILVEGNIAVTPISFNLYPMSEKPVHELQRIIDNVESRVPRHKIYSPNS